MYSYTGKAITRQITLPNFDLLYSSKQLRVNNIRAAIVLAINSNSILAMRLQSRYILLHRWSTNATDQTDSKLAD